MSKHIFKVHHTQMSYNVQYSPGKAHGNSFALKSGFSEEIPKEFN